LLEACGVPAPTQSPRERKECASHSLIPQWTFAGSIYFGCREPHLPLEFGYAQALLEQTGHEVELVDAQMDSLSLEDIQARVRAFQQGS
jgi:hypothetical protein